MPIDEEKILNILSNKQINYFDDQINTPMLRTIKAIIPYMDFQYQKHFAIMTKIFEIYLLTQIYDKKDVPKNPSGIDMGILNVLKIYISDNDLATLKNFLAVKATLQSMNSNGDSSENGDANKQILHAGDLNMNSINSIFQDGAFKNLSEKSKKLLSDFIADISNKSPMEAVGILIEYNKKIPEDITAEQKNAMTKALLARLPEQQQKQFLNLYDTLF